MRSYGKIETGFWRNKKIRPLSEDARTLLLYLLTCQHSNAAGCYVLPELYIADDIRWPLERVTATLSELLSAGFVTRDEETDLVLICGWWGHNTLENPNVAKHVVSIVNALPKCQLKQECIESFKHLQTPSERVWDTLRKGFGKPFRIPEPEPEPDPEPETQPEPEQEPEPKKSRESEHEATEPPRQNETRLESLERRERKAEQAKLHPGAAPPACSRSSDPAPMAEGKEETGEPWENGGNVEDDPFGLPPILDRKSEAVDFAGAVKKPPAKPPSKQAVKRAVKRTAKAVTREKGP